MSRNRLHLCGSAGQNTTETIVLLPLFLLLVFGVLQLGQLGVALMVANYAASAAARQMVQNNSSDPSSYMPNFTNLLTAGMKKPTLKSGAIGGGLTRNATVHACAEITAFPFVDQFFGGVIARTLGGNKTANDCDTMSSFGFNRGVPARFIVHGKTTVRMNYQPS